jgi:hypothetical protein
MIGYSDMHRRIDRERASQNFASLLLPAAKIKWPST